MLRVTATHLQGAFIDGPLPQDATYTPNRRTLERNSNSFAFAKVALDRYEHMFYDGSKRHVWQRARAWAADHRARAGYPSSPPGAGSRLCRASRSIPPLIVVLSWSKDLSFLGYPLLVVQPTPNGAKTLPALPFHSLGETFQRRSLISTCAILRETTSTFRLDMSRRHRPLGVFPSVTREPATRIRP